MADNKLSLGLKCNLAVKGKLIAILGGRQEELHSHSTGNWQEPTGSITFKHSVSMIEAESGEL